MDVDLREMRVFGPIAAACLLFAVLGFKNALQAYLRGYRTYRGQVIRRNEDEKAFDAWVRNCFRIAAGFFAAGASVTYLLLPEYYPGNWEKIAVFRLDNSKQLLDAILLIAGTALISWVVLRSVRTGNAVFKFSRYSQSYTFNRDREPLRYWFVTAFYSLLAVALGGALILLIHP